MKVAAAVSLAVAVALAIIVYVFSFNLNEAGRRAARPERENGPQTACAPGDRRGPLTMRCYERRGPAERIPSLD